MIYVYVHVCSESCYKANQHPLPQSIPPPSFPSLSPLMYSSMAMRSFVCAHGSVEEAQQREALPSAETGMGVHSDGDRAVSGGKQAGPWVGWM